MSFSTPFKANRILNLILLAFLLIFIRIWHLGVIQYEQKQEEAAKPQKKVVIEPATRGTIRDRFDLPLAINKISYQAAILYSQLREIPSIVWEMDPVTGKKIRKLKRKEYIRQLAELLGQELTLDSDRIEDLIHSKASFYAQVPFIIKENLNENEYYRLLLLKKDWPGIFVRKIPTRHYPRGRVGADIIGYMGAINKQEYEKILNEIKILEQFIETDDLEVIPPNGIETIEQAQTRLKELEEKAYTIHDYIGKTGVEGVYEKQLRGSYGKKNFYTDSKGRFLKELPGMRPSLSGEKIVLSISAELQEYAEQLLAQNESIRIVRLSHMDQVKKTILALKQPWIKGGAIVVMDPKSGEVLALATYPRFDPNDFIAAGNKIKRNNIQRWFEAEAYIGQLWNQQEPFKREKFNSISQEFYEDEKVLTWEQFLSFILPNDRPLLKAFEKMNTVGKAYELQVQVENLQAFFPDRTLYQIFNIIYSTEPHQTHGKPLAGVEKREVESILEANQEKIKKIKKKLDLYFENLPENYDKVLMIDLSRLSVAQERFSPQLIKQMTHYSLNEYKNLMSHYVKLNIWLKEQTKDLFHTFYFKEWRKKNEKEFLKEKRLEEKKAKTYPKPYLDYLDQVEMKAFNSFWETNRWNLFIFFLTRQVSQQVQSIDNFEIFNEFFTNFFEKDLHLESDWHDSYSSLQKALKPLSDDGKVEFLKTFRPYNELNKPLLGRYRGLRSSTKPLEKHLAAAFYPRYGYGYGRSYAYRQAAIQGSIFKLVTSYEALIQKFNKLHKKKITYQDLNPLIISDQVYTVNDVSYVGYTIDGKPIPQLYKGGRVPRSLAHQNSGQIDLIKALEVSSNPYFSLLAGDCLDNPEDLAKAARAFCYGDRTGIDLSGEIKGKVPEDLSTNRTGLYALAIGQHSLVVTPLQTAVMLSTFANGGKVLKPTIVGLMEGLQFPIVIKREIFLPQVIRQILLKGLKSVMQRTYQEGSASLSKLYQQHPEAMQAFREVKDDLLGKTSTSESVETIDLDLKEGTNIYTHVWFGSILFDKNKKSDEFGEPELVIVVYLRYGGYGKEAAPLAAQIVKKWREINTKSVHH